MELPRPLAPWGPYLSLFPRDLALSLGPVLQRLSLAVGPLRVRRPSGAGDPDGFDGLDRRGPYDRLLASEWLLAEEAPEEFLRRAAAGEHTFLRLARPEPAGTRISVALFDAGPNQLGAPRIAQLAALIVLARRAEAAGARFGWGILQEPGSSLLSEVTPAALLRLLAAKTPFEATDAQIEAWSARLSGWRELDDAWLVGVHRPGLPRGDRSASHLQIWDALDPRARRVKVAVLRGGLPEGEIALDLPDDAACARLLRDPFGAEAPAPRRVSPAVAPSSNLVFSGNGVKIFARGREGEILAIPVPNSPRTAPGRPRRYELREAGPVVSAGVVGRSVALITVEQGSVGLHLTHKRDKSAFYRIGFPDGEDAPEFRAGLRLHPLFQARTRLFAVDGEDALFLFEERGGERSLRLLAPATSAAASFREHILWVEPASAGRAARVCRASGATPDEVLPLDGFAADEAFFGCGGNLSDPLFGLLAVRRDGSTWEVLVRDGRRLFAHASGVVGVGRLQRGADPGLLVLSDDGKSVVLAGPQWTRRLPPLSAEIAHVAASHASPSVAYATAEGEMAIYSLKEDVLLARLVPEGDG